MDDSGSQEMIKEFIISEMKKSAEFRSRISNEWIKIGNGAEAKEYKITYAYGGQRMNIIYREPGDMGPIYNILYSDDYDSFI